MSGADGLALDADGYIDMDLFPDDGTDLSDADLAVLRDALHADPVVEPTDAEWDALLDDVLDGAVDDAPFAVDVDAADDLDLDLDDEPATDDAADLDGDPADDHDPDLDPVAEDADATEGLDDPFEDVDLGPDPFDDGGLDLTADPIPDHGDPDGLDDVPADIANNDVDDLL